MKSEEEKFTDWIPLNRAYWKKLPPEWKVFTEAEVASGGYLTSREPKIEHLFWCISDYSMKSAPEQLLFTCYDASRNERVNTANEWVF